MGRFFFNCMLELNHTARSSLNISTEYCMICTIPTQIVQDSLQSIGYPPLNILTLIVLVNAIFQGRISRVLHSLRIHYHIWNQKSSFQKIRPNFHNAETKSKNSIYHFHKMCYFGNSISFCWKLYVISICTWFGGAESIYSFIVNCQKALNTVDQYNRQFL